MAGRTPVHELLEGWLQKKKSSAAVFSNNRRWFNIREVKGSSDHVELALCYYKSQRDKEAKGWVFLKDVAELTDDEKTLTILSPARTMTLEAASCGEHRLWLQGLVQLCPHAVTARIKCEWTRINEYPDQRPWIPRPTPLNPSTSTPPPSSLHQRRT